MRNGTPQIASSKRILATLEAIVADGGRSTVSDLALAGSVPLATMHRQVTTLVAERWLAASARGRLVAGPRLLGLLHRLDEKQIVANVAAAPLDRLAHQVRCIVQLGTLENDMVTYRLKTGRAASSLFTKVGMQLEAYCSGIGKVLLAHLPDQELEGYLAAGPFVKLTANTITDPGALRSELEQVKAQGFARDAEEVAPGLSCLAVPIHNSEGLVVAATSASRPTADASRIDEAALLAMMQAVGREIEQAAFGK